MAKRTLYLTRTNSGEYRECTVTLDGPSLLVQQRGWSPRRYPFRLLRQVVVQGPVELSAPVISACLRHGITVSWHNLQGEALGHLWPTREVPAPLNERLEMLWERRDWHWKYENWRRAEERRAIRETLALLGLNLDDLRPASVARLLRRLADGQTSTGTGAWRVRFLRGTLHTLVQENLLRAGLTAECLGRRSVTAQVPEDITELLLWRLYVDLLQNPPSEGTLRIDQLRRECIEWMEARRHREEQRLRQLLDRLDYFLGGLR